MNMPETQPHVSLGAAHDSAVICDMIGCREHATGELQIGDEYIPLCELHRMAEMDRLAPKWRPLTPRPNAEATNATRVIPPGLLQHN